MDLAIQGVHWHIPEDVQTLLEQKLQKLQKWEQSLQSIDVKVIKDAKKYKLEAFIHFAWNAHAVVKVEQQHIREAIDSFVDSLSNKVRKEVDKIHS